MHGVDMFSAHGLDMASLAGAVPSTIAPPRQAAGFSPYQNNGGTVAAVSGKDYVVVGADTRLTLGYSIPTRRVSRVLTMADKVVVATAGMQADLNTLHKVLTIRQRMYEHDNNKSMTLNAVAQMVSTILYYKRFFPYYTFNLVAGLDEEGRGYVYGYDAIGSFERRSVVVNGAGTSLMQPVFDNQVDYAQSFSDEEKAGRSAMTLPQAVEFVKDAYTSAAEREISIGDFLQLYKITQSGVQVEEFALKRD